MARDQVDEALEKQYPEQFAKLAADAGWASVADCDDATHRSIANEVLRSNLGDLYGRATVQEGLAINASVLPDWAARVAAVGGSQAAIREFASSLYPHLEPPQALARYQRDLQRAAGASDVREPAEKLYDRAY